MLPQDLEATTGQILCEEPHLRRVARRLTRSANDVDDLVQEALLHAYGARAAFRPGTSIRAWTTTILRHVFISGAVRERRRRVRNDSDAGEALEHAVARRKPPAVTSAAYESFAETLEDPVKRALDDVPALYRTPLLMFAVDDLSCDQIAGALSVPRGTVMSRIHRARERLRAALHDEDPRRYRRRGPRGSRRSASAPSAPAAA
jgi:RNA polymerase sigma-70 factor (ECF subfamily)